MATSAWEGSGGSGSDVGSGGGSQVWNMSVLANGLPGAATASGGLPGVDSKSRWGGLVADNVSSDIAASGWGQIPSAGSKDSGWGRPDSDISSDVGTKAWETGALSQRPGLGSGPWGQPSDKSLPDWSDLERQKNGLVGLSPWDVRPKSWGDMPGESQPGQNGVLGSGSSSTSSAPQPPVGAPAISGTSRAPSGGDVATTTPSTSESDGSSAVSESKSGPPQALTRDEIIARAVNSNEPWGRTPIRQDTPWLIEDEPRDPLPPLPKPPVIDPADAQSIRTGTAAWEQLRSVQPAATGLGWIGSVGSGRTRDDSGSWSISPPDALGIAANAPPSAAGREFGAGVGGISVFRPPVERPASSTGGILVSTFDRPAANWTGSVEQGDCVWKDDAAKNLRAAAGLTGPIQPQQQSLRRNLSAGSWPAEEPGWTGGSPAPGITDMDDLQSRQQAWRSASRPSTAQTVNQPPYRPKPDERGDGGLFGIPPPGCRPSSRAGSNEDITAQWNPLSVKMPNAPGGWGDHIEAPGRLRAPPPADDWNRKPQQTRSRVIQQLTDAGFRKEEAQNALINNNMDLHLAIAELMSRQHAGADAVRRSLQRCSSEELGSTTAPLPDIFGPAAATQNIRFPPPATSRQQMLAEQLQQQQQQQQQQRLLSSILSSGLPINANQALQLMQQQQQQQTDAHGRGGITAESVQAALQQQQLQLLQSAHAAVQAGLIPPHLITAAPSLNPTVASKLQRLMQLYEVHHKLALQPQVAGLPGGSEFTAAVNGIKQQILQLQHEVLMALTSAGPPPPVAPQQPPAQPNDILRNLQTQEDLTSASSRLSQWKQPVDSKAPMTQPLNGPLPASSAWSMPSAAAGLTSQSGDKTAGDGSGSSRPGSDASNAAAAALEIEEFVPGKPWQGPSVRSVEDDPYITPGSVTRSTISAVDDAHVMNVLGGAKAVGNAGRLAPGVGRSGSVVWPNDAGNMSGGNQAIGSSQLQQQQQQQSQQQHTIGRSISWAAGDRTVLNPMGSAVTFPTSSLRFRNLPAQMDHNFLQVLVERHGPLRCFLPSPTGDQVLVSFHRVEDAAQAQRALSIGTPGGIPPLVIEFVSDADVVRILEQGAQMSTVGASRLPDPSPHSVMSIGKGVDSGWPTGLGGSFGVGAGGGMWGTGGAVEDHSSFLPSDLFGGQ